MDHMEAQRIQDRLRDLGFVTSLLRLSGQEGRYYIVAGNQREPLYRLYNGRAAAQLLMTMRRGGWRGYGRSA